jgi:hypothetical protein
LLVFIPRLRRCVSPKATSRRASIGGPLGRSASLPVGFVDLGFAAPVRVGPPFAFGTDFFDFLVGQVFDSHKGILSRADADQFVELDLNGGAVAVLRILNQEDHQEGHDGGACIDHKLPRVRVVEQGAADAPHEDDGGGNDEGQGVPSGLRGAVGDFSEQLR